MIIEPNKATKEKMIVVSFLTIFTGIVMIIATSPLYGCILDCIILGIWLIDGISTCRTITMDEDGCTVTLLWYHRKYRWEELKVKQLETYRAASPWHEWPFKKGVSFYPRKMHKFWWYGSREYSLIHPFSFINIFFSQEGYISEKQTELYIVDEDDFMENMKKWNVELTEGDTVTLIWSCSR